MRTVTDVVTPLENHCNCSHSNCNCSHSKRISWSAILVGALVGVGLGFLLNIFSVAIGLSAFTLGPDGAVIVALGGLIGIVLGLFVSMLVAGYTAGYLGRLYCPLRNLGIVYGFTTWTVTLLLSAVVTAHMSTYVTTYANTVSNSTVIVSTNQSNTPTTVTTKSNSEGTQKAVKINTTPKTLAWGAFSIFALLFIGAFASCVGACWGMRCCRKD